MSDPLQELAEKIVREIDFGGEIRGNIREVNLTALLTEGLGTLLQAERAATLANAAQSIRSTIFYREIDVLETRPFYLRDQIADCVEKQLPHPADAAALSAVVQRERAQAVAEAVAKSFTDPKFVKEQVERERANAVNMCVAAVMLAHSRNVSNENWATRAINCIRAAEKLELE